MFCHAFCGFGECHVAVVDITLSARINILNLWNLVVFYEPLFSILNPNILYFQNRISFVHFNNDGSFFYFVEIKRLTSHHTIVVDE